MGSARKRRELIVETILFVMYLGVVAKSLGKDGNSLFSKGGQSKTKVPKSKY